MTDLYNDLSEQRKTLQEQDELPEWYSTGGWQLVSSKYLDEGETGRGMYQRVAKAAARFTDDPEKWEEKFFDVMWKGWLSPATPVLTNLGTTRGTPVSCSGQWVGDSIYDFYDNRLQTAVLTKNGFGTSAYLGGVRHRGADISTGGKANGALPVFKGFVQDMREVSQGSNRRGAWAGYIEAEHTDFYEIADYLYNNPDDLNVGWVITDTFVEALESGDQDALRRYQRIMKIRAVTGKGYMFFVDKVNRLAPNIFKELGMKIHASNLCSEIALPSDADHTYTCVLSSMNLYKYDEWKNTDAVFTATVFLDCVAQEFIEKGKATPGMEKAVAFTEKGRALGLGVLGFHSYLQEKRIPFESFDAHRLNQQIFKRISEQAKEASRWMAKAWGEPEWCKGHGVRNATNMAIAPTMSTSLICGGVSQGIEPVVANVYNQNSAGGEISRINLVLLNLMKERGIYNSEVIKDIIENKGSVQHVNWLSDDEKQVFKTAYEINQLTIINMAAARQRFIDQAQSINLFFAADEDEAFISEVHKQAMLNPYIKSLYYMRSSAGVVAAKGECTACHS